MMTKKSSTNKTRKAKKAKRKTTTASMTTKKSSRNRTKKGSNRQRRNTTTNIWNMRESKTWTNTTITTIAMVRTMTIAGSGIRRCCWSPRRKECNSGARVTVPTLRWHAFLWHAIRTC